MTHTTRQSVTPDATRHDPSPTYLRALIARSGMSQRRAAILIGIDPRALRYYLQPEDHPSRRVAPYPVQYALERLAGA